MSNDYKLTKDFINSYFASKFIIPYHKIYLISSKHSTSKKYFSSVKDIVKKLVKKRLNNINISIDDIYNEHKWLEEMFDIFFKIFRNEDKISSVKKKIYSIFKRKLILNQTTMFFEVSEKFLHNYKEEYFLKVEELLNFYNFSCKQLLYDQITRKILSMNLNSIYDIENILKKIPIKYDSLKDMILKEISTKFENHIFIDGIYNKKFIILEEIFKFNYNRYKNIVNEFINIKYKNFDDIDMLFDMFKEYKNYENMTKKIFYEFFVKMEVKYDKIVRNLDIAIKNNYYDIDKKCNISSNNIDTNVIQNNNLLYYEFVGFLFSIINQKEQFELQLREKLCLRLINSKNVNLDEEDRFIETIKNNTDFVYVYKLQNILEDFRQRNIINNYEIMLLKKFQWVEFINEDCDLEEFNEIRNTYQEKMLRNEKKRIIWMNSLSSVEVELFSKNITLSFLQYDIIKKILDNKLQKKLNYVYENHMHVLIEKNLIIFQNNEYIINKNCDITNFLPDNHQTKKIFRNKIMETGSSKNEKLDSKIMKIMKYKKTFEINLLKIELCKDFKVDMNMLTTRLQDLEKKGFLKLYDANIEYIP